MTWIQLKITLKNMLKIPFDMDQQELDERAKKDEEFTEWFNSGYLIAKNSPEFFDTVLFDVQDDNRNRADGLLWGKWMFENEMSINQENEFGRIRNKGKEKDQDLDFDW
jgi:hypothetical protein